MAAAELTKNVNRNRSSLMSGAQSNARGDAGFASTAGVHSEELPNYEEYRDAHYAILSVPARASMSVGIPHILC